MKSKAFYFYPGIKNKYISFTLRLISQVFIFQISFKLFYLIQNRIWKSEYIRALNYHDIPFRNSSSFEAQLLFFRKYFSNVSLEDLDFFFETGVWRKEKPGLILSFDDGLRSSYEVAAPLLEKYGFTGWFLIPTEFINVSPPLQKSYARDHLVVFNEDFPDDRIAMTWDEIIELDKHHVIISHTRKHFRLKNGLNEEIIKKEIFGSKADLEKKLNHEIKCFGWVGGEMDSYNRTAAKYIHEAGYQYALLTKCGPILPSTSRYQLHRVFMGPGWPCCIIRMHLSGILDIMYFFRRKRINNITLI